MSAPRAQPPSEADGLAMVQPERADLRITAGSRRPFHEPASVVVRARRLNQADQPLLHFDHLSSRESRVSSNRCICNRTNYDTRP